MNPASRQRKWRNYLLDWQFQLRFAAYSLLMALCAAAILGVFLWSASKDLMSLAGAAVEARSGAADQSRELGNATLSNKLLDKMNDPAFEAQLKRESQEIDHRYDVEKAAIIDQRERLERSQRLTWWMLVGSLLAFVAVMTILSIITTHRIAGPAFRIRKIMERLGSGNIQNPQGGLRPSDELQELHGAVVQMVSQLRAHESEVLGKVVALSELAEPQSLLRQELTALAARLRARLGE